MRRAESVPHAKGFLWREKLCCARARTNDGKPCKKPAMHGKKRCELHGGKSTGPKTEEGKLKAARANYRHGRYTNEAKASRMRFRGMMKWRDDLDDIC